MELVVLERMNGKAKKEKEVDRRAALKWKCRVRNKREIEALKESGQDFLLENKLRNYWYQRSIEIGFFRRKKGFKDLGLEDGYWKALCGIAEHPESSKKIISINAVDWKDKTIILKIHLDRGKGQIERDFKGFLDMLYKEAEFQNKRLGRPGFHLKKLERDIDIYDRRREGKSWEEIALGLPGFRGKSPRYLERAAERARKGGKRAERVIEEDYKKL